VFVIRSGLEAGRSFWFLVFAHLLNQDVIFLQSHNAYFPISENGMLLSALATLYRSLALGLFSKCTYDFYPWCTCLEHGGLTVYTGERENLVYTGYNPSEKVY